MLKAVQNSKQVTQSKHAVILYSKEDVNVKTEIEHYYGAEEFVQVSYSEKKLSDVHQLNRDMIMIMGYIMLIMVVIAGFNLFNSMMFSIKERVSEIGIRKALGAESVDIMIQFLVEGIVFAIIGAMISVIVTTIFFVCAQIYINFFTVLNINIEYTFSMILEMGCYILSMAIIFSFIPAWIASKTNIIDAIRFD